MMVDVVMKLLTQLVTQHRSYVLCLSLFRSPRGRQDDIDGVMKLGTPQQCSSVLYLSDPHKEDKMAVDNVMELVTPQQRSSVLYLSDPHEEDKMAVDNVMELVTTQQCSSVLYLSDPHEEDKMTVDGVMKFLEELQLNPESLTVLILAWRFKAATQCEFTKDEFVNGMMEMWWVQGLLLLPLNFLCARDDAKMV